jgi:hypothetical protein
LNLATDEVDSDEVNAITEEARHSPDPVELIALNLSLDHCSQQFTPPGSECSEGVMDTNETTLRRLARYADEDRSQSGDENWVEEMKDDDSRYYTGSDDTSGGYQTDWSDCCEDENTA